MSGTHIAMRTLIALLILSLLPVAAHAAPYTALHDGESLRYRVSWGIFHSAGEITISAHRELYEGRPVFRVVMTTSTRGIIRAFYSYQETAVALIDAATGRIIIATNKAYHGREVSDAVTKFDYVHRIISHRDPLRPGRDCDFPIPKGDPIDLISALIEAREWATGPGVERKALVFADRDVYPVEIRARDYETVLTPEGDVKALLLVPRMVDEAPRGIFKRGGEIKIWVAQDAERLPVKMQLKLNIGTAQLTLVQHAEGKSAETAALSRAQ